MATAMTTDNESDSETHNNNNNNNNNNKITQSPMSSKNPMWTTHHEKILIDWADKATCYKWLHEKSQREFARKSRWFTIPVIIMSTITGTANFAQDRIPPEYLQIGTMVIGSINLIAGLITTIQQFLKINELNESHRVSAISWGKFHRNLQIELAKQPSERTPPIHLIKTAKEEYDRLIETSHTIPTHIIKLFTQTFSGGEVSYDSSLNMLPMTNKQHIFNEISKPAICNTIVSVKQTLYKETIEEINQRILNNIVHVPIKVSAEEINNQIIASFISNFIAEFRRTPTANEVASNVDIPLETVANIMNGTNNINNSNNSNNNNSNNSNNSNDIRLTIADSVV